VAKDEFKKVIYKAFYYSCDNGNARAIVYNKA
jgi:hypothetical protein